MALKSMTGFARSDGAMGGTSWHWEVRVVNGRGLDVRLRLPPGYEGLEARVREATAKRLRRGSAAITLAVSRQEGLSEIRVNEVALAQVLAAAARVRALTGGEPPRVEGLLGLKGVLEFVEASENEQQAELRFDAMMASLEKALDDVVVARAKEGARLGAVLHDQLAEVEALARAIAASPARCPDIIRQRLREQVGRLLDTSTAFDAARLHQEAVLLATRADVEEELKRLDVHVAAAHDLLAADEPVGRKLDFLSQEFNREANTLCSKSNDAEITGMGLRLRAVIDQMREQVQNIE
jgi:uncharacterized protein (TIGR00255 family)